jgi:hypothetical protein
VAVQAKAHIVIQPGYFEGAGCASGVLPASIAATTSRLWQTLAVV